MYKVIARISRICRCSDLRKCIGATKTDAEEVKRRNKGKKKKKRNGKKKKKKQGPATPRAAREEVRVVKRVLLAPRGSLLVGLFRRRLLRDLSY
jgi:hypothetical protein